MIQNKPTSHNHVLTILISLILLISCVSSLVACKDGGTKLGKIPQDFEIYAKDFYYCSNNENQKDNVCTNGGVMHVIKKQDDIREYFLMYEKFFPFSSNPPYNEMNSWVEEFEGKYTDEFFKDNVLVFAYITASSGGDEYVVNSITLEKRRLCVEFTQTKEGATCDVSAWLAWFPVSIEDIEGCVDFEIKKVKLD